MKNIPESGYYNSNKFARIFLESIEEIAGRHGLNSILNYSKLSFLIDDLPPDNLEREFDFSYFSKINLALEEIYGAQGGRGLALRIGRTTFADVLKDYGKLAGVGEAAFKVLPLQGKIKFGLEAMVRIFSERSDQVSELVEDQEAYKYRVSRCPVCWGRHGENSPVCFYTVGLLQEGMHWISGGKEFNITESRCLARGDECCEFVIPKQAVD